MSIRLGINPLTWSNDDMPDLGGEIPLETCLAEASEAGFVGVELGNKFPRDASALRPLLARFGLALVSGWYGARLLERSVTEERAAVADHLDLLARMGCTTMVFAEVSGCVHGRRDAALSTRPRLAESQWATFAARLTALGETLAARGVRLAYHHHMGTVIESEPDIDRLMAETGPAVGLLVDTGHLVYAGGDPVRVIERHGSRIVHVHCKDVRAPVLRTARTRDASFLQAVLDGVFTVPGDGAVDFPAVTAALAATGYQGWLVVEAEQDPERAHPLTYARMGYRHLRAAAAAAGLVS